MKSKTFPYLLWVSWPFLLHSHYLDSLMPIVLAPVKRIVQPVKIAITVNTAQKTRERVCKK